VVRSGLPTLVALLWVLALGRAGSAAEVAVLHEQTWDDYVPLGKEVDAIYGDYVLRHDSLVAVVAQGTPWRNANMTVRQVGGCIIDLTSRRFPSDQLGAYYPGARKFDYRVHRVVLPQGGTWRETPSSAPKVVGPQFAVEGPRLYSPFVAAGPMVQLEFTGRSRDGSPLEAHLTYLMVDNHPALRVLSANEVAYLAVDDFRADRTFESSHPGETGLVWAYDKWWGQAYGVVSRGHRMRLSGAPTAPRVVEFLPKRSPPRDRALGPGQELIVEREIFAAPSYVELRALVEQHSGQTLGRYRLEVVDGRGSGVPAADVVVEQLGPGKDDRKRYAHGRTLPDGTLSLALPPGSYELRVSALGYGERVLGLKVTAENATDGAHPLRVLLDTPARVVAQISDENGEPIPCKVQFLGVEGTQTPFFFPDSGDHQVHNLYYSHNGRFSQVLPPGTYQVIVSRGPEYDREVVTLRVGRGQDVPLQVRLRRVVRTPGWISADFHSHSSPSGDNVASQRGRVLNLLCEHIEFAPCTEHNRLDSYLPHLEELGVTHLMATCTGIELTGEPLPLNHQNAFPLRPTFRIQDNGAPPPDPDPEVQIRRLALWDNQAEKLVQVNHPDMGHMFFDRDGDGTPDGGFKGMFAFQEAIEIHPHYYILRMEPHLVLEGRKYNHRVFNWLQLINQGRYIPGVVNTDAHYNFHGSGWLRNYVRSSTDDPARIDTLEIVRNVEKGHVIVTNGPYLEVEVRALAAPKTAIPGETLRVSGKEVELWIRVQCPNWFDVDRVQVLRNGRPDPELNWTRSSHPGAFGDTGVVRFERRVALRVEQDQHLIVVAAGEGSRLGLTMGPQHENDPPVALNNPIFLDVDGNGFTPNGDTLGAPLPVKESR
jgi:hypothetical protein